MAAPVIHTYRAAEPGPYVKLLPGRGRVGAVVVDTNCSSPGSRPGAARLRALNKPLLAILVTHQHPDHLNGVFGLVQDKEAPV